MTEPGVAGLVVRPPIEPMLARLERSLPEGEGRWFEPKWDGFRCLAFRGGAEVALVSRRQRPFGRYFPELVEAMASLPAERFVIDGEIVITTPQGLDFEALLARLHPAASHVQRLRAETPATFVAFDLLALGDDDLRAAPLSERRRRLEELLERVVPSLALTPVTGDRAEAQLWMDRYAQRGVDGVVMKDPSSRYEPGKRVMVKVKPERTADCVVAGVRLGPEGGSVASLLLGLYDDEGRLRHVGVVSAFPRRRREELALELAPLRVALSGHPWEQGFGIEGGRLGRLPGAAGRWTPELERDWEPLAPERVCEVAYDTWAGDRFRHAVRFRRWRPDRDPRSCRFDQFPAVAPVERNDLL